MQKRGRKVFIDFEKDVWAMLVICQLDEVVKETEQGHASERKRMQSPL
jgi:hypothetical protein